MAYTDTLKPPQFEQFANPHPSDPNWTLAGTELDHRLPLQLGGAPRDPMSVSPEERPGAVAKDADDSKDLVGVLADELPPGASATPRSRRDPMLAQDLGESRVPFKNRDRRSQSSW